MCSCCLINYFLTLGKPEIISILGAYYSALLTLSATFATVSSVFGLFRMQAISIDLTSSYNSFRNWVMFRFEHPWADPNEKTYLINVLKVDKEPHSWLEKDIFDNIESFRDRDRKNSGFYRNALDDYYGYIKSRMDFRKKLLWLVFIPFLVFVIFSFLSLFILLRINLLVNSNLLFILNMTFFVTLVLFINLMFLVYAVWFSLNDLTSRNFNNCKTNNV